MTSSWNVDKVSQRRCWWMRPLNINVSYMFTVHRMQIMSKVYFVKWVKWQGMCDFCTDTIIWNFYFPFIHILFSDIHLLGGTITTSFSGFQGSQYTNLHQTQHTRINCDLYKTFSVELCDSLVKTFLQQECLRLIKRFAVVDGLINSTNDFLKY